MENELIKKILLNKKKSNDFKDLTPTELAEFVLSLFDYLKGISQLHKDIPTPKLDSNILKKIVVAKNKPKELNDLTPADLADLVLIILNTVRDINKRLDGVKGGVRGEPGKRGKKGDKGDDGDTPVADRDYLSKDTAIKQLDVLVKDAVDAIDKEVKKIAVKGEDAKITREHLEEAARLAVPLIKLPDFSVLITQEREAVRNALELLSGDDRIEQSAIKDLKETFDELEKKLTAQIKDSGSQRGGGTIYRLRQMLDVNPEGATGTVLTKQADGTFAFETPTGGGGTWGSITGTLSDQTDLQNALDAKANLAGGNTFTGTQTLDTIQARTSAGGAIKSNSGTAVAEFGAGGGGNWTFEDGVKLNAGTASRVLTTDSNKNIAYSSVTDTELGYLSGVTSAVQTQLTAKLNKTDYKGGFGVIIDAGAGNSIDLGTQIKLKATKSFQPVEWYLFGDNIGDIEIDVWRNASSFPTFSSDSICNSAYPSIISGGTYAEGDASTWDAIDIEDYLIITVRSVAGTTGKVTLQVRGTNII
jgi:hypothetical protein